MSTLSPEQIARHAYEAGFRGQDLTTAVAIALAESSGDPKAHNDTPPDNSYGLWQVNMYGNLGPARRDEFDLEANRNLFDPQTNAEAAFAISDKGESFRPWTTYTSGAYRRYLDEARRGVRALRRDRDGRDGGGGPGGGAPDGFAADLGELTRYARQTRELAEDLMTKNVRRMRRVREISDDSFGKIGKESGFADALAGYAGAMQRQVRGVGANAEKVARAVSRSAQTYREQDEDIADQLMDLLKLTR